MPDFYRMKATRVLSENVLALLRARGLSQIDLAQWCGKSGAWLSAILAGRRGMGVEDIDKMADFFGYRPYQLFVPGVARQSERRRGNRRSDLDRRVGPSVRVAQEVGQEVARTHPRSSDIEATSAELARLRAALTRLSLDVAQLAGDNNNVPSTLGKASRKRG